MIEHGETERRHRQLVVEVRLITVVTDLEAYGHPDSSAHRSCRAVSHTSARPKRSDSVDEQLRATYSKLFDVLASGKPSLGHITASTEVAGVPDRPHASTAVHLIDGGAHGPPAIHVRIHGGGRTLPPRGPLLPAKRG